MSDNTTQSERFVTVTKEEFFAAIGHLNVHPRSLPDASYWEMPDRRLVGKSTPGWKGTGPTEFFLDPSMVKSR